MNVKLSGLEIRLIVNAMKIWAGDFPDSKCVPSHIWLTELRELIGKFSKGDNKMTMEDLIDQFVSDLAFEVLVIWADILNVEHDEDMWLDDMWTDSENELRQEVAEAMGKVGEKETKT